MSWEYKQEAVELGLIGQKCQEMDAEGWEALSVLPFPIGMQATRISEPKPGAFVIFRRPAQVLYTDKVPSRNGANAS